jgi:hypothetical protein
MRRVAFFLFLLVACSSTTSAPPGQGATQDGGGSSSGGASDAGPVTQGTEDGGPSADDSGSSAVGEGGGALDSGQDAGNGCSVDGEQGECITTADCAAKGSTYESTPGYCPGAANIECCRLVPNVADNPPVPAGWQLMQQAQVTTAMTNWAVMILNDPTGYPMFATAMQTFGTQLVMARVEWHPPDFQNGVVHRGVTLYVPVGDGG